MDQEQDKFRTWKRRAILCAVPAFLLVSGIDALPDPIAPKGPLRSVQSRTGRVLGIWQGPWSMYARPSVKYLWLSADFYDEQGVKRDTWNSPYWQEVSGVQKFVQFRHMNYYIRMCSPLHREAAADFAHYMAAQRETELTGELKVELFANNLELTLAAEGEILDPDEFVWVTESRQLYDPWAEVDLEALAEPPPITWPRAKQP